MNCSDFLEDYSSYRDGLAVGSRSRAFEEHMGECASCTRYHQVLGSGLEMVQALPSVEPSYDFMARLQHRIYHVEDEMRASRRLSSGTSVAFTLAICVVIGLSAWLPTMRPSVQTLTLPPVLAQAPIRTESVPSLFRVGPLLSPTRSGASLAGGESTIFFRYTPLGASGGEPAPAILTAQSLRQP